MTTDGIDEPNTQHPRGKTVGVLIDSVGGMLARGAIANLIERADDRDIRLVFYFGGYLERNKDSGASSYAYALPEPGELDALVVFPHHVSPFSPQTVFETILSRFSGFPVYSLFCALPGAFSVIADETQAVENLVTHLVETHGYRKISILSGPDSPESLSHRRKSEITALLGSRDIHLADNAFLEGDFTLSSGAREARTLLTGERTVPEVIICLNAEMAIGATRELLNNGISVPEDIAIACFDDIEEGNSLPAPLTTVSHPVWEMIAAMVDRIDDDISGRTAFSPETARFTARLTIRESCGCAAKSNSENAVEFLDKPSPYEDRARKNDSRLAALGETLESVIDECLASRDAAPFADFLRKTVRELSRAGDIAPVYIDAFSARWTAITLRLQDPDAFAFINALFVDAFRLIFRLKTQLFARRHDNDLGTISFTQNCNALLAMHLSVQETLGAIAANIPLLGVERFALVFLSEQDPNKGELRLTYREGHAPDVPARDFVTFPVTSLLPHGMASASVSIAVLPIVHANTVYGYMVVSMTANRYEHFWMIQALVSQIVDAAMANDLIETRIRALTRTNDALSRLSVIDEFTGLNNRRALYSTGRQMYERSKERGNPCSFIFLDMDGLKRINDSFGHKEGDSAIMSLSNILKRCFRENDLIVRYGGDEFVVVMENIPERSLQGSFDRITEQIKSFNERRSHPWILSASWGYVYVEPSDEPRSFESVIEESDAKLYEVKRKKKEEADDRSPSAS
jgi:diguanylate cyclase (GGDEF)-like protein